MEVKQAIIDVLNEENPNLIHGYMNNSGYEDVRKRLQVQLIVSFKLPLTMKIL